MRSCGELLDELGDSRDVLYKIRFAVRAPRCYRCVTKILKIFFSIPKNIDGLTFQATLLDPVNGGPEASGPPRDLGTISVSGWAHDYGRGRVVFTAMGHTIHAMWQSEYLKMQKNAVRWLLKMT